MAIQNEEEYREALARIESIWGSEPDTPEAIELDKLFASVVEYEKIHYPMDADK